MVFDHSGEHAGAYGIPHTAETGTTVVPNYTSLGSTEDLDAVARARLRRVLDSAREDGGILYQVSFNPGALIGRAKNLIGSLGISKGSFHIGGMDMRLIQCSPEATIPDIEGVDIKQIRY